MAKPSYKPVTAALRVLDVLAAVNRLYGRATVGEIHRQLDIDKATIVRMLETLSFAGYVVRDPNEPIYRITGKTLMLSAAFDQHKVISAIVSPLMQRFQGEIDWPSDVALFDNDEMLVVESSRRGGALSFNRAPGFRAPVLGTSLGLAYIANCPATEREEFLTRVIEDPAPWNDIVRDRAALDAMIEAIRRQGYATMTETYSRQEYGSRLFSLGVPIKTDETAFASINVIYLRSAMSPEKAVDTLLGPLQKVAKTMAAELSLRMAI